MAHLDIWIIASRDEYAPVRKAVVERFLSTCAETKPVRLEAYRRYIAPHLDECAIVMGRGEDLGICQAMVACLDKKARDDLREIGNETERDRYRWAIENVLKCVASRCDLVNRHILAEVAGQVNPMQLQNVLRFMRGRGEAEEGGGDIHYY